MDCKLIADAGGLKIFAVIMSEGDEAAAALARFAREKEIKGAQFSGIGAASRAVLAWFDFEAKRYQPNVFDEQVEVTSIVGDIARTQDDQLQVHAHVNVSKRDGSAYGGHLVELHVKPTLEIFVFETPTRLRKRLVPGLPLATIRLDESE